MRSILAISALCVLVGCAGAGAPTPQDDLSKTRELTTSEKTALASIIAASLKDPGAAQFKWMPVVERTRDDGATDYCGLVNGKNSYGGYTGFVKFYVQLRKDAKGQFTSAAVRAIEEANREPNWIEPRWLNGICEKRGYVEFAQAR